ncbi:sigma-70 family RNA polymerase sigma factor [Devosia rhodophyticola]|uniref:RNA polymerase sigma factor n=1 Tax=Devosia rhodophyticola TaxID=3026423 RepID=A0ABY7YXR3_9HYPH|nr:sigma-70 family RNA polymerase sigma factor [Devosia rhodophyticola]WDR06034.1 sigma-70 family RNA polymerase sigma factor [Devosia rhodophyticola]
MPLSLEGTNCKRAIGDPDSAIRRITLAEVERAMYAIAMSEMRSGKNFGAPGAEPADLLRLIAQNGDKSALSELFLLFGPKIKAVMLKGGASDALAEDLVQETMLTVWRKAALYSTERGAPSTWIFTIARNLRIDQQRRKSNRPHEDLAKVEIASDLPSGSVMVEQNQVISRVSLALQALPAEQQEVVRLSFINDIAHSEIATMLAIPLGTVKSRLRLAYERLRPLLEDLQ